MSNYNQTYYPVMSHSLGRILEENYSAQYVLGSTSKVGMAMLPVERSTGYIPAVRGNGCVCSVERCSMLHRKGVCSHQAFHWAQWKDRDECSSTGHSERTQRSVPIITFSIVHVGHMSTECESISSDACIAPAYNYYRIAYCHITALSMLDFHLRLVRWRPGFNH